MKFFLKYFQVSIPYFSEISGSCTNFRLVLVVPDWSTAVVEMLFRTGSRWTLLAVRRTIFFGPLVVLDFFGWTLIEWCFSL